MGLLEPVAAPVAERVRVHAAGGALVGVDVGTTGVKALAMTPEGEVTAVAEEPYELSMPRPGWSEQDPDDWWHATELALGRLGIEELGGIGLSGQMHGLVCLDERFRVLRPAILWNDGRTGEECAEIERRVGRERLVELTGNRAVAGFTAPKLLWLRRHEPDVYRRIAHVLLPKDYVRLRLTGARAMDAADASGTLLFDVAHRVWSDEVLRALELPREWLPDVLESPDAAGVTGEGIPVAAGAGDQPAAALGVGVDRPGPVSISLGTSGVVFGALPAYRADPQGRVNAMCHAVPDEWYAMGVMNAAAAALRWFRYSLATESSYEDLLADAEVAPPGAEGVLFLPYLAGERTPHADPEATAAFLGLTQRHGRPALARSVLEGVAYGLRDSLELLNEIGVRPDVGRVSGGGARSRLWLRIVASVLGIPLELTAVEEGSAFGAAVLAGVAAGVFADCRAAVGACVRVRDRVEPVAAWHEAYEDGYRRFRAAYPALRSLRDA